MGRIAAITVFGGLAGSAGAQAPEAPPPVAGVISRADDLERSCEQLAAEAVGLSQRIGATAEPSLFGRLGGLARTGAQLLPGGGLVVAGADVVTGPERERRDARAEAILHRWHYLNGMYLGRGCEPPPVTPHVTLAQPPARTLEAPPLGGAPARLED